MKLLADATLPGLGECFGHTFDLQTYNTHQELCCLLEKSDILLCRSTVRVNQNLLANSTVRYVATASSGIDHLDTDYFASHGIKWFDAKGSNASSVADYVMASVAHLKKENLLRGKKAGVIGVGHVGSVVLARLEEAGFEVIPYDPPRASIDDCYNYGRLNDITRCDLIFVHANLHETLPFPSKNLLDEKFLNDLKPGCVVINASRGDIVNEEALLGLDKPITYCTDVYSNEPDINPEIVEIATLCTPHIAGHSIEAKVNAVIQISEQLHNEFGLPFNPSGHSLVHESKLRALPVINDLLSLYNPANETNVLKQAKDKRDAFLFLRKSHTFRHDFSLR